MKKILIGFALVMAATASQASYLYWQVTNTGTNIGAIDTSNSSAHQWTYTIYATNDGGTTGTALTSYIYNDDTDAYDSIVNPVSSTQAAEGIYADITAYNTGYSYYIEITGYNSAAQQDGWINRSQTLAYAAASGNITETLSSMATVPTAWTGGTFSAPEPTGAMLLLVGGALLALKRKRV